MTRINSVAEAEEVIKKGHTFVTGFFKKFEVCDSDYVITEYICNCNRNLAKMGTLLIQIFLFSSKNGK